MRRPNPSGWKGGSESFTFLSATRGRTAEDHYGVDDGYDDRRNDSEPLTTWGDCGNGPEHGENTTSDPWEDM